jgi:hypothetical protein
VDVQPQVLETIRPTSDLYRVVKTSRVPEGVVLVLRGGCERLVITYDPQEIARLLDSAGTVVAA